MSVIIRRETMRKNMKCAKSKPREFSSVTQSIPRCLYALAMLLVVLQFCACSKKPESGNQPAKPPEVKNQTYRMIGGRSVVAIVSSDELEIRQGGENLVCKYTKQDNKLRVIVNALGTTTAKYFDLTPQGLVDEDGDIFYEPANYDKVMAQIELNRQLWGAVEKDDATAIDELLLRGAAVETRDASRTALVMAAENGLTNAISLLLKHSADPNQKIGSNGETPIWKAIVNGNIATTELLLKHGARHSDKRTDGVTPLMLAASIGGGWMGPQRKSEHDKILSMLCETKADLNAMDKNGNTALMLSLINNNLEATKILVAAGADRSIQNSAGRDAFALARGDNDKYNALQTAAEAEAEVARLVAKASADQSFITAELQADPPVFGEIRDNNDKAPIYLRVKTVDAATGAISGEIYFYDMVPVEIRNFEGCILSNTLQFVTSYTGKIEQISTFNLTLSEEAMEGRWMHFDTERSGEISLWLGKEMRIQLARQREAITPSRTIATYTLARPSSYTSLTPAPTVYLTDVYVICAGRHLYNHKYKFIEISGVNIRQEGYLKDREVVISTTDKADLCLEFATEADGNSFYSLFTNAFAAWSRKYPDLVIQPKQ